MQIQVEIGFEELLEIIKRLPQEQFLKLKNAINIERPKGVELDEQEDFWMDAPTFSKEQIEQIEQTRKTINQWLST